tara:strand:+ start:393 stop:770 length:378 start_codon:yes stop_codon:yes gene_type:complete
VANNIQNYTLMQDRTIKGKVAMLEALEQTLGVVTTACKMVGIERKTHYNWLEQDEDYMLAVKSIEDVAIDFAESQLHKQIKKGSTSATVFYLKTKGKKRGYVERQEHELSGGAKPINIQIEIDDD